MKKIMSTAITAALLAGGAAVAGAPSASAACVEVGSVYYTFSAPTTVWKSTNLRSSYITGPGSISLTKGRSWTASASMTATVAAEAGIVFAKASTSIGVTVGASYSGSLAYTYTLNVASGTTRAMQQYKSARTFTVTKKRLVAPCTLQTVYSSSTTAPIASNADSAFKYALVA